MKKLLLILLFPFFLKAQVFTKLPPDVYYHMGAGALISLSTNLVVYRFTNIKMGIIVPTGIIIAGTGGIIKEEWYDRHLGLGTPTTLDKLNTGYGGVLGAFVSIPIMNENDKKLYELEQYENLNIKTDTLKL